MAAVFIGLWIAGGFPAGVLGEVVQADSARTRRAGRIAFAFLLWIDLLVAALVLAVGADAPTSHMTEGLWWFTIIVAGIPLALVSGLAVRRGYAGHWHLLALTAATLTTAALYVAFPLAFIPATQPLTGLGRWVHEHHLLGIAILFIPTLILLVNELFWNEEATPEPEPGGPSFRTRLGAIPRRYIVGTAVLVLLLIWLAGTNSSGMLLGLGVVFVGTALFLWYRDRAILRSVRRDLGPPEKP
jgi:hypothetical protein